MPRVSRVDVLVYRSSLLGIDIGGEGDLFYQAIFLCVVEVVEGFLT